jgi:large subunit ribosomal protein L24
MAKMKVKTGDKVLVLTGKDNGKVAEVLATYPQDNRVVVKGVNVVSKNKKARHAREKGGIIKFESKIDVSNVQIVCPGCGKATRIGAGINEKGVKHRVCKKCGASLDSGRRVAKKKPTAAEEVKSASKKKEEETSIGGGTPAVTKSTIKDAEKSQAKIKTSTAKSSTQVAKSKTAARSGK